MAEFLVEMYVSRTELGAVERGVERTRISATRLSAEGTPVRCLRSLFVPDDETCFLLYEAGSADAVRETLRRAGLAFERVAEAVTGPTTADPPAATRERHG